MLSSALVAADDGDVVGLDGVPSAPRVVVLPHAARLTPSVIVTTTAPTRRDVRVNMRITRIQHRLFRDGICHRAISTT